MPKIDVDAAETWTGTGYPPPHDGPCQRRVRRPIGDVAGLTQFGVNILTLEPGQWSSQRHWHTHEDEFVWILEGEVILVTDDGEEVMRAGDCAGFPAGAPNGHHLQNRADRDAVLLEVGSRREAEDATTYPDVDMHLPAGGKGFTRKDGTPY